MQAVIPAGKRCSWAECPNQPPYAKTLKKCSQCQRVLYCGRECQRADWKRHKINCISPRSESEKRDLIRKGFQGLFLAVGLVIFFQEIEKKKESIQKLSEELEGLFCKIKVKSKDYIEKENSIRGLLEILQIVWNFKAIVQAYQKQKAKIIRRTLQITLQNQVPDFEGVELLEAALQGTVKKLERIFEKLSNYTFNSESKS